MKIDKINKYYTSGQPKICKICGKVFAAKWGKKYCSVECKRRGQRDSWDKTHKEKGKTACPICGKEFEFEKQTRAARGKIKYCSPKCRSKYSARAKYQKVCIVCGKEFISKYINAKACSVDCRMQLFATPRKSAEEKKQTKEHRNKRNNELEMIRARTDPAFALKRRVRILMYHSLRGNKGGQKWQDLIGYSVEDLRCHIEKQFTDGMNWEKFLDGAIHIDHKIPVVVHNITSPNDPDFKKCWALKNLQPLWQHDNLSKHDRLDEPFQPSLAIGKYSNAL